MKRKSLKRAGLLLALLMLFSLLPAGTLSALAEEPGQEIASAALSLTLPQPGPTGAAEGQPVPASASALILFSSPEKFPNRRTAMSFASCSFREKMTSLV